MAKPSKTKPENDIRDIMFEFLSEQQNHFSGGLPTVQSEWVQEYLDQFAGIKSAMLDEAESNGLDPELYEILERFLNLTDERNADGSIDRRMLLFHIRLAHRVGVTLLNGTYRRLEESVMQDLISLDFNKESVCKYYQKQVPIMKEKGIIKEQEPQAQELLDGFQTILMALLPGDTVTYELGAKSLRECVEEAKSAR